MRWRIGIRPTVLLELLVCVLYLDSMTDMQATRAESQPDWRLGLPRDVFYEIVRVFRGALPLPEVAGVDRGRRDRAAIAGAAAFRPVDASEAGLAAQIVLSEAWAAECLRLSGERGRDFSGAMRCRAQALGLMRDAKGARRLLAKTQAGRVAMERDEAAAGRAEMAEHVAVEMMGEALGALSARESEAEAVADAPVADAGDVADGSVRGASPTERAPEIGFGAFFLHLPRTI